MSDLMRIGLVAEGVTDYEVIHAAIDAMLVGHPFSLKLLQPEGSVAFSGCGNAGALGGGWKGVYKWCLQSKARGDGRLSGDILFANYDMLVIHLDADVASESPAASQFPIYELEGKLPCEHPCPPPEATTNALRSVMLSWTGETILPARIVLCTPSKSTETWVMFSCFPDDSEMARKGWECHPDPASRLGQQSISCRFSKRRDDYKKRRELFKNEWARLVNNLSEGLRFNNDFLHAFREVIMNRP